LHCSTKRARNGRNPPRNQLEGLVTDIQRFSLNDGPGIRTLVFLKGCPLCCPWCSNPEAQRADAELLHYTFKCIRCGSCAAACTRSAVRLSEWPFIDSERCNLCGDCSAACPSGALRMVGETFSVARLCEIIEKDRVFYDESGGGATFSGGEPFFQPQFLEGALETLKAGGIHTAVETCGYVEWPILDRLEKNIDLFLYDLKILDAAPHLHALGASNAPILDNLRKLAARRDRIIVRIPVIPGFTLVDDNILRIFDLVASLPSIRAVHLLPYHNYGMSKYRSSGRSCPVEKLRPPGRPQLAELAAAAERMGLECIVGG
jgi:pyruvate formate lyase activating enzyme